MAALNKENCEEHPRSKLASNSIVPRSQEDYITQVSEEIEGRVTKKLSQEFSRTENRILGALAGLDDFLMNPLLQGHSGTTPEASRNVFSVNQGTIEDDSQSNPHPEAGLLTSAREDHHDVVTAAQRESVEDRDMVTGGQRENLCQRDRVTGATGVHEEIMYCSPSTSSRNQKKNRSTSQPQFHSENTPATIEADQILMALQQLANNNISANFHNNIDRTSKLPKSLTTTMPTFDGKSEKFELFEDLSQTSLKIHNQLTEEDRINYFLSLMRGDALQTFKNMNGPTRENLGEILAVFRRKYVKPQPMATAKHKFQKLVFNPANQKLVDFFDELQRLAKDASRIAAHVIIEQFIYAKMPPHLKKSKNQSHLESGTYEQIVTHLEKELELNGLEAPDELQINTVSHNTVNANADRTKPTCQDIIKISADCWKNSESKLKLIKKILETKTVMPIPLTQTATSTILTTTTETVTELKESQKLFTHPVRHVVKQTIQQRDAIMEPMQPIDRLPGEKTGKTKSGPRKSQSKWLKLNYSGCSPEFKLNMPRLHSEAATDRPEETHLTLPPIPEVVWQQPQETYLNNIHNDLTNQTHTQTHMSKQKNDVEAQTSPIKETSFQVSGSDTESFLENQTRSIPVQCPNDSNNQQNEIQRNEIGFTTYANGDDNISPPEITTSQIQEQLVRDDITNELYMPLSSTIVLKRKKEMLYVPLDFENGLTTDAFDDSGAYVSAIAQKELDRIQQQAPSNNLKIDDPPNFQIQVANGQLEKPTATATVKFDIGDHIFAEHFVVMKNLTGPIIGLHFMKHNSVVIDTTHGLTHFPNLTMQVKSASSQASAKPQCVLIYDSITIPQMTTKTITAIVDHVLEWKTTGTVTPVEKFTEAASLIISHSMPTIIDRKIAVRVTNTTELLYTINKNTQIAEFSVVTPEQFKFIKPVDMAILSMIPVGDPDLVTYLTELLRTNKPDQQTNTFWFPTPKKPGNTEDHTPIQTRILTELRELQRREKLNPEDNIESRTEFLKRFDWTDTLLTETKKQAFEDILV